MKKSDAKGTYKEANKRLQAAKDRYADKSYEFQYGKGNMAQAYQGMKNAEKDVKKQTKTVSSLKKYNKGARLKK